MTDNKENKMGVMPVKKLIISMSVPMMFSMLVQALYNIVDSVFVSWISEEALTAVTVVFPIQNLMIAVGTGTGVGINALLSRSLGEKNYKTADKAANSGLLLAVFSYLLFLLIGFTAVEPFVSSQTDSAQVRELGITYGTICCCCSIGVFCQITLERLLQSTGRTVFSMMSQLTGAIINSIMDPILIFGLFGAPKLGVAGAACATIFGQVVASCLGLFLNLKYNKDIHLSLSSILKPDKNVIKSIYAVGIPSILMVSVGSVMTYLLNLILKPFSSTATAVYGAYFKLQSFFFMPVFGLNNGSIPVLAYNLGARKADRIKETLGFSVKLAFVIMTCGTIVFELIPTVLLGFFHASDNMLRIGVPALRIIAVHFPVAALSISLGSVFQAFSKSGYSLIVSLCRQLVVLIPVAWLMSLTGVLDLVWISFPVAEIVSFILTIIFYKKVMKSVNAQISSDALL